MAKVRAAMTSSAMKMKEQALAEIKAAWKSTEKHNLEFGKVCCEWRDKFRARGFRKGGDGVVPILEQLGIPTSTAYFWMNKYEISIGAKPSKPQKQKPDAPSVWTRADEKRANRSDPIADIKTYKLLASKMLEAGYRALLAKKAGDQSHLWAATRAVVGVVPWSAVIPCRRVKRSHGQGFHDREQRKSCAQSLSTLSTEFSYRYSSHDTLTSSSR